MNSNKQGYFSYRNAALASKDRREMLGEREINTLIAVLNISDNESFFQGKHIVDLGCGDQYIKKAIIKRGACYQGLDVDVCDLGIEKFPLEDNSIDMAISLALIEHIGDPSHFLTEIKRVLKPGGVVWLSTPDIKACGADFWNDPTHVHPYTRSSLRMLLQMNGFTDVRVTPNYRCKPSNYYLDTDFNFLRARHLLPLPGISRLPAPEILKGKCTGLFALAKKTIREEANNA